MFLELITKYSFFHLILGALVLFVLVKISYNVIYNRVYINTDNGQIFEVNISFKDENVDVNRTFWADNPALIDDLLGRIVNAYKKLGGTNPPRVDINNRMLKEGWTLVKSRRPHYFPSVDVIEKTVQEQGTKIGA